MLYSHKMSYDYFSVAELYLYLIDSEVSSDVASKIRDHKINGELFLELGDEELKEVAPALGDRAQLKKLQRTLTETSNQNEEPTVLASCPGFNEVRLSGTADAYDVGPPPAPYFAVAPDMFYQQQQQNEQMIGEITAACSYPVTSYPVPMAVMNANPAPIACPLSATGIVNEPKQNASDQLHYVHTQFGCSDKCCIGNQFWVHVWLLIAASVFGPIAIPFLIVGLVFAVKAALLNRTGDLEDFEKARKWEKRAAICGDIGYWVLIGMVTILLVCSFFGIPIAIIVLVIAIPSWVVASLKENELYKYKDNP